MKKKTKTASIIFSVSPKKRVKFKHSLGHNKIKNNSLISTGLFDQSNIDSLMYPFLTEEIQ